jgi:hypothetical protein
MSVDSFQCPRIVMRWHMYAERKLHHGSSPGGRRRARLVAHPDLRTRLPTKYSLVQGEVSKPRPVGIRGFAPGYESAFGPACGRG